MTWMIMGSKMSRFVGCENSSPDEVVKFQLTLIFDSSS